MNSITATLRWIRGHQPLLPRLFVSPSSASVSSVGSNERPSFSTNLHVSPHRCELQPHLVRIQTNWRDMNSTKNSRTSIPSWLTHKQGQRTVTPTQSHSRCSQHRSRTPCRQRRATTAWQHLWVDSRNISTCPTPQADFFIKKAFTWNSPTHTFLLPNNSPTTHNHLGHIERVKEETTSSQTLSLKTFPYHHTSNEHSNFRSSSRIQSNHRRGTDNSQWRWLPQTHDWGFAKPSDDWSSWQTWASVPWFPYRGHHGLSDLHQERWSPAMSGVFYCTIPHLIFTNNHLPPTQQLSKYSQSSKSYWKGRGGKHFLPNTLSQIEPINHVHSNPRHATPTNCDY